MDKFCVCGKKVTTHTGGYSCPSCLRQYNVNGKQVGSNMYQEADERMKLSDITTLHYNDNGGSDA
jgi:hypothetical protein